METILGIVLSSQFKIVSLEQIHSSSRKVNTKLHLSQQEDR